MATRSRFREFSKMRAEHYGYQKGPIQIHDDSEDAPIANSATPTNGEVSVEMSVPGMPKVWGDIIADVKDIEKETEQRMTNLAEMQKRHLSIQFSAGRDEGEEERKIEIQTAQIAKLFKEQETLLMLLEKELKEDKRVGCDSQRRMVENMKTAMVLSANALSRKFRDGQRIYLQRLTKMKSKKPTWNAGEKLRELEKEEAIDKYIQRGFSQDQVEMMIMNEYNTQQRDTELRNILKSISELHEMFRDMNTLVVEQGTVLDRIDYNLTVTRDKIAEGVVEVTKAKKYTDQTRYKLCFLLLLVMVVAFSVAIVIEMSS